MKWNTRYINRWIDELDIMNPYEVYQGLSGAYGDVWDRVFYNITNQEDIPMRVYPAQGIKIVVPVRSYC